MFKVYQKLKGKRFYANGYLTPYIKEIKMKHIIEPDTPKNDYWGNEWDEMTVFFEDGTEIPLRKCLEMEIKK